jgi:hypothetical protein
MSNSIKYNPSPETLALNTGDFWIGTGDVGKGPTSTTGFWNAINPPEAGGGYTIYNNKADEGPSIRVASNDDELIAIINENEGTSYTDVNQCLNNYINQDDRFILNSYIYPIVTDGLVLSLDASLVPSYPRNGITWYDLSGEGNDGTLIDAPSWSNGYFDFDGSTGYIAVSNLGLSSHTIEGWINSSDASQGGDSGADEIVTVIGEYDAAAASKYTYIGFYAPNILTFRIDDGTSPNSHKLVSNVSYTADTWYHVALTYNASDGRTRAYLNGRDIGGITYTTGLTFDSIPFNIAQNVYNGNIFDGLVGPVRTYNRALTASEVAQNYYQSKIVTDGLAYAIDAGNLVSYESPSTTAYSLVGIDNDGTLVGGVTYRNSNNGNWEFDGVNDKITLATSIPVGNGTSPWAISAWVKTTTEDSGNGKGSVISNNASGPVYSNMGVNDGKIVYWVYQNTTLWTQYLGTTTVNDGEWHQLTWVNNSGATMDMYVDGVFDTNISNSLTTNAYNYLNVIGGSWTGFFDGNIANLQIYNTSLTADEVSQNYTAQSALFQPPSIAPQA